ncbi:putative agc agc-unique protein kinase [Lyophyllum shimeji]|uniref:non-specific serine/threonine protein kinase n=1 Tax=Lyophyllum shimeji TaxID=47721 RepID=A0A9P3PV92_LYOSH|nr:putative agc agc-unique protein kinase [Lyophyllum shimeji]
MTVDSTHSARRTVPRTDQEGPWSVSVAETPHDASSYSLYIKTPTHNLTLTRTAKEIVELDRKLRESHPGVKLPAFPIDMQSLPAPPKRKSIFLNTLSRLASPTSGKTNRRLNNASVNPSNLSTPLTSPSGEVSDPFSSFAASALETPTVVSASANSPALASYLTTISNTPALRQARVWKRFVRVRTDDLESVRVERAIKRVRSDLAAHVGGLAKEKENVHKGSAKGGSSVAPSESGSIFEERVNGSEVREPADSTAHMKEEVTPAKGTDPDGLPDSATTDDIPGQSVPPPSDVPKPDAAQPTDSATEATSTAPTDEVSTPVATETPARIQRSHSVDFDKSRMSRAFANSTPSREGASSQTGDESSASTTGGSGRRAKRKKRSRSRMPKEPKKSRRKVVIDDFEMMRVLGKGCAGKVLLVRQKASSELYALKAITKRHVLAHQELQHTLTEQAVLKRMAAEGKDPFVVKLWWSFHDKENLFLVMDFHPGGDLATQLARWGRLGRDRARFYAAEIVEGCEGLHAAGVIYRDLKPENILIGADGHIVLTDFGLSKEFPRRATQTAASTPSGSRNGEFYSSAPGTPQPTSPPWMRIDAAGELALGWPGQAAGHTDQTTTFCGTAEYLAPEVIQGLPYSYEVDWWSFGTMLYEMLTGITPFWANNHSDMYVRVLQDELQFPEDRAIDQDTKSLIRGLLQRNPALRICEPRIKKHPYFSMIDWSHVYYKRYIPPYIPPIDPSNASDTQNFDDTFLDMEPVLDEYNDEQMDTDQEPDQTDTDRTDGEDSNTTPSQSRSSSVRPQKQAAEEETVDVFDGYSFKGRHSVLIDDDEEEEVESSGSEGDSEEDEEDVLAAPEPSGATLGDEPIDDADAAEGAEPETPEARPAVPHEAVPEDIPALPPKDAASPQAEPSEAAAEPVAEPRPRKSKDLPPPGPSEAVPPTIPEKDTKAKPAPPPKGAGARGTALLGGRTRREKSGVAALDRYLSDAVDEDTEVTEREEDEDDDWDFVEAADGEDRNGAKGTTLFARGVVDRYRLAVFRKASTPSQQRSAPRSFSGMSKSSELTASEPADSPSPSQKRGRAPLTFRKHPKQFLRPKSPGAPPSSYSSKSSATAKSLTSSNANTLSAASSSGGLLTPSTSVSHSLKSKESAVSVGAQSQSSEQSGNGETGTAEAMGASQTVRSRPLVEEPEKHKNRKLKKYKENAEKVFSLFSSPRQPS